MKYKVGDIVDGKNSKLVILKIWDGYYYYVDNKSLNLSKRVHFDYLDYNSELDIKSMRKQKLIKLNEI